MPANVQIPRGAHRGSVNPLRRTVRQAKNAFNYFITTHREGVTPGTTQGRAIPLSLITELLCLIDISDAYRTPSNACRQPAKPCPFAAQELYGRLLLARRHAWWLHAVPKGVLPLVGRRKDDNRSGRRPWYIADADLPGLLEPVALEMRRCLEHVESFCGSLSSKTSTGVGHDLLNLSELRACVFQLMGFWPHDVRGGYLGCAFDLPSELAMLLYPQICLDRDEMAENLEKVVLCPGWDCLYKLEDMLDVRGRGKGGSR